jgi:hypothetical protein
LALICLFFLIFSCFESPPPLPHQLWTQPSTTTPIEYSKPSADIQRSLRGFPSNTSHTQYANTSTHRPSPQLTLKTSTHLKMSTIHLEIKY